jgi:hypothetical protein
MDYLSVGEAAGQLGVSERRVRALLQSDQLAGRQVAGRWLVDERAVHARGELPHEGGRPLSQASAWSVLAALAGAEEVMSELPKSARSRARRRANELLRNEEIASRWPSAVASRAKSMVFYGHPAILANLLADPRVVRSGVSATRVHVGLVMGDGAAEGYVRSRDIEDLASGYGLDSNVDRSEANVLLHVVESEQAANWLFSRPEAPVAVVAADLAEREPSRERAVGLRLAAEL